jgi:hypothetical protein
MIVSGSNNLSDDSDDEVENSEVVDAYRRKYQLLLERCEVLQQVKFYFVFFWQCMPGT